MNCQKCGLVNPPDAEVCDCGHAFRRVSPAAAAGNMEYYLYLNDEQKGPFTLGQLKSMWGSGSITLKTLCWHQGLSEWLPLSTMRAVLDAPLTVADPNFPAISTQRDSQDETDATESKSIFTRQISFGAFFGVAIILIIVSFGFVHWVILDDVPCLWFVPKSHFTYTLSIVTVDEVIQRYNNRSLASAFRGDDLLDRLVDELQRQHFITMHKKSWEEIQKDVAKQLPDH